MPQVRVLGPVGAVDDGGDELAVGGERQRRLLGALALDRGFDDDALISVVWPREGLVPERPVHALRTYVSRLRGVGVEVERGSLGYRLAPEIAVDVREFESYVASAADRSRRGDLAGAANDFGAALAMWRGPALGQFAAEEWAAGESARLEELRLRTSEQHAKLLIRLDRLAEASVVLRSLCAENPLREGPHRLLMLATHLDGDQVEALRVYQQYRDRLADESGLDPSAELVELEQRILAADPDLASAPQGQLGSYVLGELIGEGAFGAIYRATQPSVDREVAIKVVRAELANDPDFVRRFEVEAQTVARLEHPHIVPLHDFWREPGGAYLVMRFLRGGSAEERLVRDGPLPLPEVSRLVDEIGGALAAAHDRGVVHRDVKPANILYDEDGHSYLADFGIAVDAGSISDTDLRSAGSPLYAAPEQVRDGDSSVASDIYAFGIVLYELLTGRSPFVGVDSLQLLLERKVRDRVPSVSVDRPDCPRAIDLVVQTATHPDVDRRFETMGDLILAFRAAAGGAHDEVSTTDLSNAERPRRAASQTLVSLEVEGVNPYKGLAAFGEADAGDFFGREALASELQGRVDRSRFVVVTGPSGSGKSSVVKAGLVPVLRAHGSYVASMTPGAHPFDELETALLRVATAPTGALVEQLAADERGLGRAVKALLPDDDAELILVIDQFEELFTLSSAEDRDHLLVGIAAAVTDERSQVRVACTLRADFYDRPLQHPAISELVQANTLAVTPLSGQELDDAITQPAARVGIAVEQTLVSELVSHVAAHPASLPLLQYVLTELFERRESGRMTLDAYQAIGGLTGALANRADELHDQLAADERGQVRRMFTRLVSPGEGTEDTRRRVRRTELAGVDPELIDAYGLARLLTFDHDPVSREPTVEVAHEALIREWPRLRAWIDEDRDGLRLLRHLGGAAEAWQSSGRDVGELYRGGRLEAAEEWASERGGDMNSVEEAFLAASVERRDAEADATRRAQRRLRNLLAGVGVVAVIAIAAGVVAFQQRGRANDEAAEARTQTAVAVAATADALAAQEETASALEIAESERTRAEDARSAALQTAFDAETGRIQAEAAVLVDTDRRLALLLAAESYRRQPGAASLGALQRALTNTDGLLATYGGGTEYHNARSLGGERLIGTTADEVHLFDTASGRIVRTWQIPDLARTGVYAAQSTPMAVSDDYRVAVGTVDGRAVLIDPDLDDPIASLPHDSSVVMLAWSPDGRLATGDEAGLVRIWDVESAAVEVEIAAHPWATLADMPLPDNIEWIPEILGVATHKSGMVFDDSGQRLLTADVAIMAIWDTTTGAQEHSIVVGVPTAAVPSGNAPLSIRQPLGFQDGRFWLSMRSEVLGVDPVDGALTRHPVPIGSLAALELGALTADGAVVVEDGGVRTVDLATGAVGVGREIDGSVIHSAATGQSGHDLFVTTDDGIVRWSLEGAGLIHESVPRPPAIGAASVSADRETLVLNPTFGLGGQAPIVWDLTTSEPMGSAGFAPQTFLQIDWNGDALSAFLPDRTVQYYELGTFAPLGPGTPTNGIGQRRLSPDGMMHALSPSETATVDIFDTATGELIRSLEHPAGDEGGFALPSFSFDADWSRAVGVHASGETVVWDVESGDVIAGLAVGDDAERIVAATFSRSEELIALVTSLGRIHLLDARTFDVAFDPISGLLPPTRLQAPSPIAFSPDDRFLVTVNDGEGRLWSVEEGTQIGEPFPNAPGFISGAVDYGGLISLITGSEDRIFIWNIEPERWFEAACRAAGRSMTESEWSTIGPRDLPYEPTCASFLPPE